LPRRRRVGGPRASVGLDCGASIGALWAGRIKRAITVWYEQERSAATLGNYSRHCAEKKAPHEGTRTGQRCVQARLGLGGDKLDVPIWPTRQASRLFRRTCEEKSSEWECPRRIVPLQWRRKERSWRGFRLFRSRVQTAVLGAKTDVPTWIPKFQHLNALFNWLDPDKRHQLTI
jgi:hypothetical protein